MGGEEWCVMRLAVLARVEFIAMARKRYDSDVIAQNIAVRISAQAGMVLTLYSCSDFSLPPQPSIILPGH